jgi:FSR family fosmidomycin resistance protein-like MFS transporter
VTVPFTSAPVLSRKAVLVPVVLGAVHFIVDASSNFVVARLLRNCPASDFVLFLLAYNFLAFALQPLVGLAADRLRAPRGVLGLGLLLSAAAMVSLDQHPLIPLVLTGLGNAMFHVGGGTIASLATWGRATGPGLFIAPGALGVVLGAAAGRSLPLFWWPIFLGLLVTAPLGALLPVNRSPRAESLPIAPASRGMVVFLLLLFAIAGRSLLGARVSGQQALQLGMALPLAIAALSGKALGGLVADWAGWTRTALISLTL